MINLTINGQTVEANDNSSILKVAQSIGIEIPVMCYLNGYEHITSCMICLVEDTKTGALLPSCSVPISEGMVIETQSERVISARKDALELLLSDHIGDCEAPCQKLCPASMNIPQMNRLIAQNRFAEALINVKKDIALPSILGHICPAPCEKGCRRGQIDEPISICLLKRFVGEQNLNANEVFLPAIKPASGKKVAIIGTGPTGLAAAYFILQQGHACCLFDKNEKAGGMLRYGVTTDILPTEVLNAEIKIIEQLGAKFRLGFEVTTDYFDNDLHANYDAIVVATGEIMGGKTFGLASSKTGLAVDMQTFKTSASNIFAGGNAIRVQKMAIRAAAHGKHIAYSINQLFEGKQVTGINDIFNSKFGKLIESEFYEYLKEAEATPKRIKVIGSKDGFLNDEAIKEAKRCLHCDCRKQDECLLREYSNDYEASQKRYWSNDRKSVSKLIQKAGVIYEPQKCIKCGRCVRITEKACEKYGLAFTGRGFTMQVDVPFNESLDNALTTTAKLCVESCPTGALCFFADNVG